MRWQSILKTIHIRFGLICGILLVVTCLSGSIAVFRPQLQATFGPKVTSSGVHADLDLAAAAVLAQNPGARLTRVLLPAADRNTFVLTLESEANSQKRIVIDAGTGDIAGELNVPWLDWIIDLHHNLLHGRTGRGGVGVVGIILFVMSLSGLVLSLRKVAWKSLITVTTAGPRRRFYFELHRVTGVWAYAFLTLLSFTGIALAFPDSFRAVLGKRDPIAKPSGHQAFRPLKDYIQISASALADARLTELRLPKTAKDPISMRFLTGSDLGDVGRNELALDPSGRILGIRRTADQAAGVRLQSAFTPIHYGEVGGLAVRVLWCVAGLTPLLLFITGLLLWFRKVPRAKAQDPEKSRDEFLVTRQSF